MRCLSLLNQIDIASRVAPETVSDIVGMVENDFDYNYIRIVNDSIQISDNCANVWICNGAFATLIFWLLDSVWRWTISSRTGIGLSISIWKPITITYMRYKFREWFVAFLWAPRWNRNFPFFNWTTVFGFGRLWGFALFRRLSMTFW